MEKEFGPARYCEGNDEDCIELPNKRRFTPIMERSLNQNRVVEIIRVSINDEKQVADSYRMKDSSGFWDDYMIVGKVQPLRRFEILDL